MFGCAFCGDGFEDAGLEDCDDANGVNGDGCENNCTLTPTGTVEFTYVLLQNDGAGNVIAATDCVDAGVSEVRLLIGNERTVDGILDDDEVLLEGTVACNQLEDDGDGILDPDEFGLYSVDFFTGQRDLFAVEFLDAGGATIGWQTFDVNQNFTRFSFAGGINILENVFNILVFAGDADPNNNIPDQLDGELQSFFGF
jgi:cysteine-rich repeat protein